MVEAEPGTPTWKFTQCFGDKGDVEDITEADIISTVEFDHTGNYLATGDKGGRVVLFERNETVSTSIRISLFSVRPHVECLGIRELTALVEKDM